VWRERYDIDLLFTLPDSDRLKARPSTASYLLPKTLKGSDGSGSAIEKAYVLRIDSLELHVVAYPGRMMREFLLLFIYLINFHVFLNYSRYSFLGANTLTPSFIFLKTTHRGNEFKTEKKKIIISHHDHLNKTLLFKDLQPAWKLYEVFSSFYSIYLSM
jgi:hypothetical protein